jgi:hypothetical protein
MHRIVSLLAVICLGFAPVPFRKPANANTTNKDLRQMQGKWLLLLPNFRRAEYSIVSIKGNFLSFGDQNNPQIWQIEFPSEANHKRIDLRLVTPGSSLPFSTILRGIYRLDGPTLTIGLGFSPDAKDRPLDIDDVHPSLLLQLSNRTEH